MNYITKLSLFFILFLSWNCKKESDTKEEVNPTYTIVNNGNAGVTGTTDTQDNENLEVIQAIPSVSGETYPNNMPVMFFLNDKVNINSIKDNFIVKEGNIIVGGTISLNEAANGYAILIFTPSKEFNVNKEIQVIIKKEILDDGGNGFFEDYNLTYVTKKSLADSFDNNKSFESGEAGVSFIGDGAVLSGSNGSINPNQGTQFSVITSGDRLVSSNHANGQTSSMMVLGPISKNISSFSFYYDFISAEFNDYVGSEYDDSGLVTIIGSNSSYTELFTSVNKIGESGNFPATFLDFPDGGDNYVGHTGWKMKSINLTNIGTPAYIIFTVTDVGDKVLSTALAIDNISF